MTYTDMHGRPELVMHPAIKRAQASYRLENGGGRAASPASVTPQDGPGRTLSGSGAEADPAPRQ